MKYKVGNKVRIKSLDWYDENKDEYGDVDCGACDFTCCMTKFCGKIVTIRHCYTHDCYTIKEDDNDYTFTGKMIEGLAEEESKPKDMSEVSDGYHTFNELYEYRMLYNASFFNELAKQNLYDVHKSKKHSNGEDCFGGGWFIVMAELPTGQVSNHYELKDWDLFQVPEKEKANKWDGHTPQDVAKRMREFLTPKPKYPKTYEECEKVLRYDSHRLDNMGVTVRGYKWELIRAFQILLICRDAYWKIAGEEMGLGKSWEPDWNNISDKYCIYFVSGYAWSKECQTRQCTLAFPTPEMRDAFYENFKSEIETCKELL